MKLEALIEASFDKRITLVVGAVDVHYCPARHLFHWCYPERGVWAHPADHRKFVRKIVEDLHDGKEERQAILTLSEYICRELSHFVSLGECPNRAALCERLGYDKRWMLNASEIAVYTGSLKLTGIPIYSGEKAEIQEEFESVLVDSNGFSIASIDEVISAQNRDGQLISFSRIIGE